MTDLFGGALEKNSHEIQDAVIKMFKDLEDRNMLGSVDRTRQAILEKTARALDAGLQTPKVSVATANLVTKVLESLNDLPVSIAESDSMDAWDLAAIEATRSAMSIETVDPAMIDTEAAL